MLDECFFVQFSDLNKKKIYSAVVMWVAIMHNFVIVKEWERKGGGAF